jgi:hypothetical protein
MKINNEALDATIKKLIKAKDDIKNSNHDSMSIDDSDFEPSEESVEAWMESLKLPMPILWRHSNVDELPEEYWEEIFGNPETNEGFEEVKASQEYKSLFELYEDVFSDMYLAASEEAAYYENEAQQEEKYYNSMRGPL